MDKIKPLFAATATVTGGRNGHTEASDGSVAANLSVPKEMGGPGKPATTTPEHLFAAGAWPAVPIRVSCSGVGRSTDFLSAT